MKKALIIILIGLTILLAGCTQLSEQDDLTPPTTETSQIDETDESYELGYTDGLLAGLDFSQCLEDEILRILIGEKRVLTEEEFSYWIPYRCCIISRFGTETVCDEFANSIIDARLEYYWEYLPHWEKIVE